MRKHHRPPAPPAPSGLSRLFPPYPARLSNEPSFHAQASTNCRTHCSAFTNPAQAFYNTSPFTLRDLKARANQQQLKQDFEAYLDGFSPNVQDILTLEKETEGLLSQILGTGPAEGRRPNEGVGNN